LNGGIRGIEWCGLAGTLLAQRARNLSHLDTQIEEVDDAVIVRPVGEVDFNEAAAFRIALLAALNRSRGPVVVDLARLDFIDSTGLTVLLAGHQRANERGLDYSLAAPQAHVARRLNTTGLNQLFQIHDTLAEALDPASTT
jgi:anti-sigma B factor antagonist